MSYFPSINFPSFLFATVFSVQGTLSSHLPYITESQNSRGWKGPLWVI